MDDEQGAAGNELAQTLGALARSLQAESDTAVMLDDLVAAAVTQIPGADEASISVVEARRQIVSEHRSSELAARIDALQVEVGEGPCLDAVYRERIVWAPDLARETRWPAFARRAAETGVGSMMSLQLWVEGDTLGTLNLYSRRPHAFDAESEQIGLLFVSHAAVAMAGARKHDQLVESVNSRDLIGQAKGMLMERYAIDAVKAFALLIRASQNTNTKLRDVATELTLRGQPASTSDVASKAS
ncbi:GAF domain-containing protein [Friedmanniella luteola]|uniref:GAF domain-containing protein n=1 Tax=Friedmanniella luteola TaxID=546871 RepID=A0A1H1T0K9_9ACTN|nr:GAF and ANTAR domain-containing protein [Friedmanniella luteola]SDS53760.1 GAF domain-containing protein [Friedmanniella luteola]